MMSIFCWLVDFFFLNFKLRYLIYYPESVFSRNSQEGVMDSYDLKPDSRLCGVLGFFICGFLEEGVLIVFIPVYSVDAVVVVTIP